MTEKGVTMKGAKWSEEPLIWLVFVDTDGNECSSRSEALRVKDEAIDNGAREVEIIPLYECVSLAERYESEGGKNE